jgi:ferredoxin
MDKVIYYFTGSGNSLKVAKDLADNIRGAKLVQICRNNMQTAAESGVGKIGIVFPVYYYGLPAIVREFLEKLKLNKYAYVFSVATCGGSVGAAMRQLKEIIDNKGVMLSAAFRIIMPDNYQVLYAPPPEEKQQKLFKAEREQINEIARIVNNEDIVEFHESGKYFTKIFGPLISSTFKPYNKDMKFWIDNKCNGCGICSKICPANNIKMNEGKPQWLHKCEHCLACMHWCPKKSIQYNKGTVNRERYHQPEISVQELFQKV